KDSLPPGVPEVLGGKLPEVRPVSLPAAATCPDKREFVVQETAAASAVEIGKAKDALSPARRGLAAGVAQAIGDGGVGGAVRLTATQRALEVLATAELDVPLAEARYAALLATLRAERLEDAGQKDSDEWKSAATEAGDLQRKAGLLEARRNLRTARQAQFAAQSKMRTEAAKKVADAEKALAKAEADAKLPLGPVYTPR